MKIFFVCFIGLIIVIGCTQSESALYKETDILIQSLQTTYESYGILGGKDYSKTTSDGLYTITPIGRLINVKIQKAVGDDVYEELRKDIEEHYRNDTRVNKVYICQAGTIIIDCRN